MVEAKKKKTGEVGWSVASASHIVDRLMGTDQSLGGARLPDARMLKASLKLKEIR